MAHSGLVRSLVLAASTALGISGAFACATGVPIAEGDGPGGDTQAKDGICLLHNCESDDQCGACSDGRNTCKIDEKRCVACDAETGTGCPSGQQCSSYGNCVPVGLDCPTDSHGVPQISCASSADCAACDPMHQVCDTAIGQCVACTDTDTSSCQSTDICSNDQCSAKCPTSCMVDNDCGLCGAPGNEAHACNAHKCAECSPTYACPAGKTCSPEGTCLDVCGTDGSGTCFSDADCDGCGASNGTCHAPINGGAGKCGVSAPGCSNLGNLALPSPWNQVTNTCSSDQDCAGVGVDLNVGKMLRDITGIDQIGDASINYPMGACASVDIGQNASCGLCVPCRVDSDCQNVDIDQVSDQMFGSLGGFAADLLLDQIFGPSDHQVHMYCQNVAGDYGVCAPCPGILYECGVGSDNGNNGGGDPGGGDPGGGGSCNHDECTSGGALDGSCSSCASDVCNYDGYCCSTAWDATCVSEADQYCNGICGGGGDPGGGGGGPTCHDECAAGDALDPSCDGCVQAVCTADSYCCTTEWDSTCVGEVDQYCSPPC